MQAQKGTPTFYYLFRNKATKHSLIQGPTPTLTELLRPYDGKAPAETQVLKVPANRIVVSCSATSGCLGVTTAQANASTYYYLLQYHPTRTTGRGPIPEMTGADLVRSGTRADFGPAGEPIVTLQFTGHGAKEWNTITRAEAERGATAWERAGRPSISATNNPYAQHFAIVLDGHIESTPYIDFQQFPNGIGGSNAEIDLNGAPFSEAKSLAFVLQTGSLPYKFQQIERTDVSATLGKDSLTQAWHAALLGLAVVAIFLVLLYRFLGVVAVFGLAVYAALYYAAILLFNVTLTLPGFAGLILTIGVAADANVVVFERIKEEVRSGKSVRAAIAAGYGKGFHTILDANVVTAITALVLFLIAVASVKGFALMLLIGTIISLLTAVAATRAMLGLLAGFKWFENPRFMGAHGQQTARWLQIDFMRRRYLWFALSAVILVAGAASLTVRGLNLGIDFKGGTQITFKTHTAQTTSAVRRIAAEDGQRDAIVQGTGSSTNDTYTGWQVRTTSLKSADLSQLTHDFRRQLGAYASGSKDVSSSFGHQIAIDAIYGIIVSLALIIIYIALRFDIKFAVPVIVAMIHDILITIGLYSLVFKEVTIDTVAAVLTVLGYSIYDTIIIFDRIRENVPLMSRKPFATITNVSLWETIRRSLATTFITLLPIAALELLGGPTLRDFAFALLIGVASGAYSSIFIAAPLLTMWKEREPEYARRKELARAEGGELIPAAELQKPKPIRRPDLRTTTPTEPSAHARRRANRRRRSRRL